MFVERSKNGWVVHTPAKINLALEVLGRQTDGYHRVETLLVPVRLFDTLAYSPSSEPLQLRVQGSRHCQVRQLATSVDENLAVRAMQRLAAQSGHEATGRITLVKRIPVEAGLGGGSSDAAAALVIANEAWGLGYRTEQLAEVAGQIGTDVPFFLNGGAALGTGRGERVTAAAIPAGLPIVLVQPPVGLSTPKVFAALGLAEGEQIATGSSRCRLLVEQLKQGVPIARCKPLIRNCLQQAAAGLCDWIERIAHAMDRLPVVAHQMTGSGSGYIAVCRSWRDAQLIASRLRCQPWRFVAATQTCR